MRNDQIRELLIEADRQVADATANLQRLIDARDAIAVLAGRAPAPTRNGNGSHPILTRHGQTHTPGLSATLLDLVCDKTDKEPDARFTATAVYDWLGGRWSVNSVRWAIVKLVREGLLIDTGTKSDLIRAPGAKKSAQQTIYAIAPKGGDR